jgi:hypothetical protein
MTRQPFIASCLAAAAVVLLAVPLLAQGTTGAIHGIIKDPSGAVLPGVTVTARGTETGRERVAVTDGEGRFLFTLLPVGPYSIRAELTGFQTQQRQGIEVGVGQDADINFTLALGTVSDTVNVTGGAPMIETTHATVGGLVDGKQIQEMPLNGRDFMQLAMLQAGVASIQNSNLSPDKGTGIRASFGGARPYQTGYLLDGTDISTRGNFRSPGSAAGVSLGVDTVREFQVLVNSFSAEFGNAAGGIINAVTRSGTNQMHGTAFEFARNSKFDARNFFDPGDPAPFKRNQFGFTVGGPAIKDKLFYFGAFEGLRQELSQTLLATVPNAAARAGILPTTTVTVAAAVQPYLALWPLPNGRDYGDGTGEYHSETSLPTRENFWMFRGDYNLGRQDALFVRFSKDDATSGVFGSALPNIGTDQKTRYRHLTVEETKVFSGGTLNMFRASRNYTHLLTADHPYITLDPSLWFVPNGREFGEIIFGGNTAQTISNPGSAGKSPSDSGMTLYQLQDSFTMIRGAHAMKIGGMMNRYQLDEDSGPGDFGGQYQFTSLANFLRGVSSSLRITAPEAITIRNIRQSLYGFFAQDDWKAKSNLTLNVGLRYEFITEPTEKHGYLSTLPNYRTDTTMTTGKPLFNNPSLKNFAPRLGLAWDVGGTGRTAVRAGLGLYHDEIITNYFGQVSNSNPPYSLRLDIRNPVFPDAVTALNSQRTTPGAATINIIDADTHQPKLWQFNVSVQRALGQSSAFTVAYVGSRGIDLQREVLVNTPVPVVQPDGRLFFSPAAPRYNPAFGAIFDRKQDASSRYDSLQLKFDQRLARGLQSQSSFTWGKSVDDASVSHGATDFGPIQVGQNPVDPDFDRGLSNWNVTARFTSNFSYKIPEMSGSGTVVRALLAKWQIAGILTISSGTPFYPIVGFDVANVKSTNNGTRPNLAPGASDNPIHPGNPDQYFDPSAFTLQERGYLGNLKRNTLIGPGLITFDGNLSKKIALGRGSAELRVEGFNLFNRANFANPSGIAVFDASGPVASAGRITSTITTSRQIQFGARFSF